MKHRMLSLSTQRASLKPQNGRFPCNITLRLKIVCYNVCLCNNFQHQSCNTFIGLSISAKMIGGGRPLKRKLCIMLTSPWRGSRADLCFHEIWRKLYLHRNYYNKIWNY